MDELRIMWAHCEERVNGSYHSPCTAEGANVIRQEKSFEIINNPKDNIGGSIYSTSTYYDEPGRQRAKVALPGQGYVIVNFAYSYSQILNNFGQFLTLNFNDRNIEKLSSYAVRSRWIDEPPIGNDDGLIQPTEYRNNMHICVNCNILSSDNLGGGPGRRECVEGDTNDPASGCQFNR